VALLAIIPAWLKFKLPKQETGEQLVEGQ
jgi:hypothetical protein